MATERVIDIKIPLKPYLKKFLSNFSDTEPYIFSKKDIFGRYIVNSLEKCTTYWIGDSKYNFPKMTFRVPAHILELNGNYELNNKNIQEINKYLRDLFYFTFLNYVKLRQSIKKEPKTKSIDAFVLEYDLDYELLNRDNLTKYIQRNY